MPQDLVFLAAGPVNTCHLYSWWTFKFLAKPFSLQIPKYTTLYCSPPQNFGNAVALPFLLQHQPGSPSWLLPVNGQTLLLLICFPVGERGSSLMTEALMFGHILLCSPKSSPATHMLLLKSSWSPFTAKALWVSNTRWSARVPSHRAL